MVNDNPTQEPVPAYAEAAGEDFTNPTIGLYRVHHDEDLDDETQ